MTRAAVVGLSAMRIGIGALAWLRPDLCARLFGLPRPRHEASYLWRLFGVRDVAIGVATLRAPAEHHRGLVTLGLVCDAADGTAAAISRRDGAVPAGTAPLVAVPVAAVGLGLWLLRGRA